MKQHIDEKLFTEFNPVSTPEWEQKIIQDLKGADYQKKLIWRTLEGFEVKPYYRKENLEDLDYLMTSPGSFPYTRSGKINDNTWEIRQDVKVEDVITANKTALSILEKGVTSLGLNIHRKINNKEDFNSLLKDIYIDCISLNFISGKDTPRILEYLLESIVTSKWNAATLTGSFNFDPLGNLTLRGAYYTDKQTDFSVLRDIIGKTAINLPEYKLITVNGLNYSNAGASAVQELAFSLSMGCEYLSALTDLGIKPEVIAKKIQFINGTGSNYFMEIAKLRALRTLWAKILESYGIETDKIPAAYIHSVVTEWNKTIFDPYVNILRATTEAMSAVLGGTDSLAVTPFDSPFAEESEFSARIARNIQIILKEEAYFDKVIDPAAGSYYIENLTDQIIENSWKLFLSIEDNGGYIDAFKKGFIRDILNKTVKKRLESVAGRKEVLLGTNQFPDFKETVEKNIAVKTKDEETIADAIAEPVKPLRAATELEDIRFKTKNRRPAVFMLTIGNPVMRKARSGFSCNFFACGGYEVIDNIGFSSVEEGVKATIKAKADIIVLCSGDDEYLTYAPRVYELVKDRAILVIAGEPACKPELEAKGIKNFISMRSNLVESLRYYNKLMGI